MSGGNKSLPFGTIATVRARFKRLELYELFDILLAINTPGSLKEMVERATVLASSGDSVMQERLSKILPQTPEAQQQPKEGIEEISKL